MKYKFSFYTVKRRNNFAAKWCQAVKFFVAHTAMIRDAQD